MKIKDLLNIPNGARREAVAQFRHPSHDCLGEHLHRITIYSIAVYNTQSSLLHGRAYESNPPPPMCITAWRLWDDAVLASQRTFRAITSVILFFLSFPCSVFVSSCSSVSFNFSCYLFFEICPDVENKTKGFNMISTTWYEIVKGSHNTYGNYMSGWIPYTVFWMPSLRTDNVVKKYRYTSDFKSPHRQKYTGIKSGDRETTWSYSLNLSLGLHR